MRLVAVEMQVTEDIKQQGSHRERTEHCQYPKALPVREFLYDPSSALAVAIFAHRQSEPRKTKL